MLDAPVEDNAKEEKKELGRYNWRAPSEKPVAYLPASENSPQASSLLEKAVKPGKRKKVSP